MYDAQYWSKNLSYLEGLQKEYYAKMVAEKDIGKAQGYASALEDLDDPLRRARASLKSFEASAAPKAGGGDDGLGGPNTTYQDIADIPGTSSDQAKGASDSGQQDDGFTTSPMGGSSGSSRGGSIGGSGGGGGGFGSGAPFGSNSGRAGGRGGFGGSSQISPYANFSSGGGLGGSMATNNDFMAQYNQAFNSAQTANNQRYNDIMTMYGNLRNQLNGQGNQIASGYQDRYNRVMGGIDQFGQQQRVDAGRDYAQLAAKMNQDAISRGLGNTSARFVMQRGAFEDYQNQLGRINSQILQQRANMDAGLSGESLAYRDKFLNQQLALAQNQTGVMERRTDAYPNMSQYAQLAQMQGVAQAQQQGAVNQALYNQQQYANAYRNQYYTGGYGGGLGDISSLYSYLNLYGGY